MPTISIFYGIAITMRQREKEHNPPHIHARYGEFQASFYISNGEIMNGAFPARACDMVKEFILQHQNELMAMWNGAPFQKLQGLD